MRLKRGILLVALALLTAGCGGNSYVQFASTGSPATGVSTGSSVYAQSSSSNSYGALLAILLLGQLLSGGVSEPPDYGTYYRANPFPAWERSGFAPQLDPSRRVHEQDCAKPIEDGSANLKCR